LQSTAQAVNILTLFLHDLCIVNVLKKHCHTFHTCRFKIFFQVKNKELCRTMKLQKKKYKYCRVLYMQWIFETSFYMTYALWMYSRNIVIHFIPYLSLNKAQIPHELWLFIKWSKVFYDFFYPVHHQTKIHNICIFFIYLYFYPSIFLHALQNIKWKKNVMRIINKQSNTQYIHTSWAKHSRVNKKPRYGIIIKQNKKGVTQYVIIGRHRLYSTRVLSQSWITLTK